VRRFTGHESTVWSVAVTPDGKFVVSGSDDKTVRLWDLATGKEVRRFTGHEAPVYRVAVTPDGQYVVSGSGDKTVRVWYIGDLREQAR
jgi:WD40 repeat protein